MNRSMNELFNDEDLHELYLFPGLKNKQTWLRQLLCKCIINLYIELMGRYIGVGVVTPLFKVI